jgi:hypothetical protein
VTGTKSGAAAPTGRCWRRHLCTRFALIPCDSATAATDAPACFVPWCPPAKEVHTIVAAKTHRLKITWPDLLFAGSAAAHWQARTIDRQPAIPTPPTNLPPNAGALAQFVLTA